MSLERTWAAWAADPATTHTAAARALAQDALVDVTACMIAGAVEPPTQAAIRMAARFGEGAALAIGSSLRLPAPWAAFISGTAAHALDFDDNFAPAVTHATAVLAPALFALADEEGSSGANIIDAYLVGLELQARIGRWVNPSHYEQGWHATSTVGTLGTAAGCARLLGLDAAQTLAALSIAFSMASGSRKQFGSMMKPIHAGLAAKNAVLAARMAQAGIEGNAEPVGGQWGFAELYGASDREDATKSLAPNDAGQRLAIETDGLMAKRFPCCAAAHRTLDGLAELQAQYRFPLESVERVDAWVPAFARANLRFDDPQNEMEARFSLPYCAVRVLQTGRLSLSDMTREKVREEAIRPWLQRIVIHTKPGSVSDELGERATPAVTRVTLEGRRVHEIGVLAPKGSRCVPLTEAEQLAKFRDCCAWAGAEREAERLFALARSISRLSRFGEFSEALTGA